MYRSSAALLCATVAVLIARGAPLAAQQQSTPLIPRGPFSEEEIAGIKAEMLDRINEDRWAAGIAPVEWQERAAWVGDLFCAQALADGTVGHYTLEGLSPLDRWGLAGGTSFSAENTCAWMWTGAWVDWSVDKVLRILHDFQDAMLSEVPPDDGHRKTILNPWHTHVGIGLAIQGTALRYAQEFVSKYVELTEMPLECTRWDEVVFRGRVMEPGEYRLDYVLAYYSPAPRPLTVAECARRTRYDLPNERRILRPILPEGRYYLSDRKRGEVHLDDATGAFSCIVPWFRGDGWYGIVALLAPRGSPPGQNQFPATWALVRVADESEQRKWPPYQPES